MCRYGTCWADLRGTSPLKSGEHPRVGGSRNPCRPEPVVIWEAGFLVCTQFYCFLHTVRVPAVQIRTVAPSLSWTVRQVQPQCGGDRGTRTGNHASEGCDEILGSLQHGSSHCCCPLADRLRFDGQFDRRRALAEPREVLVAVAGGHHPHRNRHQAPPLLTTKVSSTARGRGDF